MQIMKIMRVVQIVEAFLIEGVTLVLPHRHRCCCCPAPHEYSGRLLDWHQASWTQHFWPTLSGTTSSSGSISGLSDWLYKAHLPSHHLSWIHYMLEQIYWGVTKVTGIPVNIAKAPCSSVSKISKSSNTVTQSLWESAGIGSGVEMLEGPEERWWPHTSSHSYLLLTHSGLVYVALSLLFCILCFLRKSNNLYHVPDKSPFWGNKASRPRLVGEY